MNAHHVVGALLAFVLGTTMWARGRGPTIFAVTPFAAVSADFLAPAIFALAAPTFVDANCYISQGGQEVFARFARMTNAAVLANCRATAIFTFAPAPFMHTKRRAPT